MATRMQLMATLALMTLAVSVASATTFTVSTTSDAGSGSLREAIMNANADATATAGSPHIINATGISGVIGLTSALPSINNHITINGPGAASLEVTRSSGTFGIFTVNSGKTATIAEMSIANGYAYAGGGIYNNGTLTINNCTVSGNSSSYYYGGGGIYNDGTLLIENTTLFGNSSYYGGGIYNDGTLTVDNCTISGNFAFYGGGGIYNDGTLTIETSTVSGNYGGGGIYNGNSGTLTIENTTVSWNYAYYGGGIYNDGTMSINTSTVSWNYANDGGGIYNGYGTLTVDNCTISRNYANDGGGIYNGYGTLTVENCTVSGNYAYDVGGGGGVANDGTLTMNNCTVSGNYADVGGGGGGGVANDGTLTMNNCTVSGNSAYHGGGGGIYNDGMLTIETCTVSGNSSYYYYGGGIYNDGMLTIEASTVSGNSAPYGGGGIYNGNSGTVTIETSTVSGNSAPYGGGGIYNGNSGTVTIETSTVSGNSASNSSGGGIYNNGTLTIEASTVSANSASIGGGIYNYFGTLTIANCTVSGNYASLGGGIRCRGTLTIENCTVSGNYADVGGGVANEGTLTIDNCTISGNSANAAGGGGGIYNYGYNYGTLIPRNTIIAGNTAAVGPPDVSGSAASQGHNLIGKTDGSSGWVASDLTGTVSSPLDPMLDALADNGGPTQTMALHSGSPAINAGDDAVLSAPYNFTTDQRGAGYPRKIGSHVDIGAYEGIPAPMLTMPADITLQCDESTDPSNTGSASATGYCDLEITHSDAITEGSCANSFTITRTWRATDDCGNTTSDDQVITVEDTHAPTISLRSSAIEFWPPNHSYHTVNVSDFVTGVSDNCASLGVSNVVITYVTSDETETGNGDGNTLNDIIIGSGCHSVQLRSERCGNGNGRVYRIHVAITDGCGNTGEASFPVSVRKSQGGSAAVEGSALYTVAGICSVPKVVIPEMEQAQTGSGFYLMQNYPNPFTVSTVIEYSVSEGGPVHLTIVDVAGHTVVTLVDKGQDAGQYTVEFNSDGLASGSYFYVLESKGQHLVRSMTVSK